MQPVETETVQPAFEIPPYAALYKSSDCTGEYLNLEVDEETGMGSVNWNEIWDAGYNDNTNSISVGSWFAVYAYQHEFSGIEKPFFGVGDLGTITCYPFDEDIRN